MLAEERAYYQDHLQTWLHQYSSRFVLVHGSQLIGVYESQSQALTEGARRFGLKPFLVRQVTVSQPEVKIPALTLGLIHVNPEHASDGRESGA